VPEVNNDNKFDAGHLAGFSQQKQPEGQQHHVLQSPELKHGVLQSEDQQSQDELQEQQPRVLKSHGQLLQDQQQPDLLERQQDQKREQEAGLLQPEYLQRLTDHQIAGQEVARQELQPVQRQKLDTQQKQIREERLESPEQDGLLYQPAPNMSQQSPQSGQDHMPRRDQPSPPDPDPVAAIQTLAAAAPHTVGDTAATGLRPGRHHPNLLLQSSDIAPSEKAVRSPAADSLQALNLEASQLHQAAADGVQSESASKQGGSNPPAVPAEAMHEQPLEQGVAAVSELSVGASVDGGDADGAHSRNQEEKEGVRVPGRDLKQEKIPDDGLKEAGHYILADHHIHPPPPAKFILLQLESPVCIYLIYFLRRKGG
jgi:hypothetical protein